MPTLATLARTLTVVSLLAVLVLVPPSGGVGRAVPVPPTVPAQAARVAYAALPLAFAQNQGQADPAIRFLARGSDFSLALAADALTLSLAPPASSNHGNIPPPGAALRFTFPGANPAPTISAAEPLPGTVNYLIGNDPSQWRTAVPTAAKVRYRDLYPGIDLDIYGRQAEDWEYDVIVAPGVDPTAFTLAIGGAVAVMRDDTSGDLVIGTGTGEVRQHTPVLYQEVGGERRVVGGGYVLRGDDMVGFAVGAYDPTLPLVIDPSLAYSTYLGGSGSDLGHGIAVDVAGNAYVTGSAGTSFPTTPGSYQSAYSGNYDVFVTKLNATGSALYSTYLGGSGTDVGYAITVDNGGDAYITGTAFGTFPTTVGAFQTVSNGGSAFVTKLNPNGTALVYSTFLGNGGNVTPAGVVRDSAGDVFVTGRALGGVPITPGAYQTIYNGFDQAFVTKLNATGAGLVYSTYLSGTGALPTGAAGIAIDGAGNAYLTGGTNDPTFPTTPGAYQRTFRGGGDTVPFVTKMNATGNALVYSTYLGGSIVGSESGIAVDTSGNAYVTGPVALVTKLNAAGSALVYNSGFVLGNGNIIAPTGIAIDSADNAYVTGYSDGALITTPGAYQPTNAGASDAFVVKLNPSGTVLYSTYLGGVFVDHGTGIAVDNVGNAYIVGYTDGSFPTTPGAYQTIYGGDPFDAFVAKFSLAAPPNPLPAPQPTVPPAGGPPAPVPRPQPSIPPAGGPPAPLPPPRP
ncbi:MAG: SBBP repeat-containing protein [Thermomicrobiales bacterium]